MKQEDYSQPGFYTFSEDSIILAKYAAEILADKKEISVVDLGAGSGVVGLEFAKNHDCIQEIIFVELQKEWKPFLESNIEKFSSAKSSKIVYSSFSKLKLNNSFDIVLSNPPYFLPGTGRASSDKQKQTCRTFETDSIEVLIECIDKVLKPLGVALILARTERGEIRTSLESKGFQLVKEFGKTGIFQLRK